MANGRAQVCILRLIAPSTCLHAPLCTRPVLSADGIRQACQVRAMPMSVLMLVIQKVIIPAKVDCVQSTSRLAHELCAACHDLVLVLSKPLPQPCPLL